MPKEDHVCVSTPTRTDSTAALIFMPGPCTCASSILVARSQSAKSVKSADRVSWARRSPLRSACSWQKSERLTLTTCLGTASCGRLGWKVPGAADAKAPTAIRELREKEEKSSQFRGVSVDKGDHLWRRFCQARRCWDSDSRNLRTSPSPSASVDLPSTRPQRGCRGVLSAAYPLSPRRREIKTTNSLRCVDERGRRGRGTLNHLFGIVRLRRTSPVKEIRRTPPFIKTTDNRYAAVRSPYGVVLKSPRPPAWLDKPSD